MTCILVYCSLLYHSWQARARAEGECLWTPACGGLHAVLHECHDGPLGSLGGPHFWRAKTESLLLRLAF